MFCLFILASALSIVAFASMADVIPAGLNPDCDILVFAHATGAAIAFAYRLNKAAHLSAGPIFRPTTLWTAVSFCLEPSRSVSLTNRR